MKKLNWSIWLAALLLISVSCKDDDDDDTVVIAESDRTFINNAADGGMFEVKAGELAVSKGDSIAAVMDTLTVKSFGRLMINDHTKANNELKALADKKNADVPDNLSTAKQQKIDSLNAVTGTAFNRLYAKMMVASHQETVNLFQTQAASGADSELKSWASSKLPTLQHHLEMARMMQDSIR